MIDWDGGVAGAHEALAVSLEAASALLPAEPTDPDASPAEATSFRVYRELGDVVDPPGVLVGPPELAWSLQTSDPTEAVFSVIVAVQADDRSVGRLYALVPVVSAALDDVLDANVKTATPGAWDVGNSTLPAYFMRIEVALR